MNEWVRRVAVAAKGQNENAVAKHLVALVTWPQATRALSYEEWWRMTDVPDPVSEWCRGGEGDKDGEVSPPVLICQAC